MSRRIYGFKKIVAALAVLTLVACGGSGGSSGGSSGGPAPVKVGGAAVKDTVIGGIVTFEQLLEDGTWGDLLPLEAEVKTGEDGTWSASFRPGDLTFPVVLRAKVTGGTLPNGGAAPDLTAISEVTDALVEGGVDMNLTAVSTIAAKVLEQKEEAGLDLGALEDYAAISEVVAGVLEDAAEGLGVEDLNGDPTDSDSSVARFNDRIDENLDIFESDTNNGALDDILDYMAADLSDGDLDGQGSEGDLDPADYGDLTGNLLDIRKLEFAPAGDAVIGSNGTDSAELTVSLSSLTLGAMGGETVNFAIVGGQGALSADSAQTVSGAASVILASDAPGEVTVEVSYTLPNSNVLSEQIVVTVTDCQAVAGLSFAADRGSIINNGLDFAALTAEISAACEGSIVPDTTEVSFAVTAGGDLEDAAATTIGGAAGTNLTSLAGAGTALTVSAAVVGTEFSQTLDILVVGDPCSPGSVVLTADPALLTVGASGTLTAEISPLDANACGGAVDNGIEISFSATGSGDLTATSATTIGGAGSVEVIANAVGTISAMASVAGVSDSVNVTVLAQPTSSTLTVELTGVSANEIGALDLSLDYDQSVVTYASSALGGLMGGAMIMANDNDDKVTIGLIHANGFDGTADGAILVLEFDVAAGIPSDATFPVASVYATDLGGNNLGLTPSNFALTVTNN